MVTAAPTVEHVLASRAPGLHGAGLVPGIVLETPLGPMLGAATAQGVCLLEFTDRRALSSELRDLSHRFGARFVPAEESADLPAVAHLRQLSSELSGYFAGKIRGFGVALDTPGTDFEKRVWDELLKIPFGTTVSYGAVAARIGNPGASRAVGSANGRNRVAIVVPCHRVIQEDGSLGGYGGGLDRKRTLLDLERSVNGQPELLFT